VASGACWQCCCRLGDHFGHGVGGISHLGDREAAGKLNKFEQGSALAGYAGWEFSAEPLTEEDEEAVVHNPTASML
jgi:hypothetical protein